MECIVYVLRVRLKILGMYEILSLVVLVFKKRLGGVGCFQRRGRGGGIYLVYLSTSNLPIVTKDGGTYNGNGMELKRKKILSSELGFPPKLGIRSAIFRSVSVNLATLKYRVPPPSTRISEKYLRKGISTTKHLSTTWYESRILGNDVVNSHSSFINS